MERTQAIFCVMVGSGRGDQSENRNRSEPKCQGVTMTSCKLDVKRADGPDDWIALTPKQ